MLIVFCILCLLLSSTDSSKWETPNSRCEFWFTFVMIDSTDIFRNRGGKRSNRNRKAAMPQHIIPAKVHSHQRVCSQSSSSQSSGKVHSHQESDCASEYSSGGSTVSELCRHRSHTEGTEDAEQTENEGLRYKVRFLQKAPSVRPSMWSSIVPVGVHRCGHR